MSDLELDESGKHRFEQAANGYGAVVCGESAMERKEALETYLPGDLAVVDCREIHSPDDFIRTVVMTARSVSLEELQDVILSGVDVERALRETETGLVVWEFDSMDSGVQTAVAQLLKGVVERRDFEEVLGYTCEDCNAVVQAEPDLASRVQSWTLSAVSS